MTVFLVRHAKAGSRQRWDGPDDQRPLTKQGRAQADMITALLRDEGVTQVISSPYVRCRQTVEPLAQLLRLPVDLSDALTEGAPLREALRLLEKVSDETTILCTHGDVMGEVLAHAERDGVVLGDSGIEKGCTWALDLEVGTVTGARYIAAPQ